MEQYQRITFDCKKDFYNHLNKTLVGMIENEEDWLANLCNSAALLGMMLNDINWSGFYLYKNNELVLGPFWGKPACTHIAIGEGVCGTAAQKRETIVVDNVFEFPGHIACDSASRSEIVVPIIGNGQLYGVLDIDSPDIARFDNEDAAGLEQFVSLLLQHIDFTGVS